MADYSIKLNGESYPLLFNGYSEFKIAKEIGESIKNIGKYPMEIMLWGCVVTSTDVSFKDFCAMLPQDPKELEPIFKDFNTYISERDKMLKAFAKDKADAQKSK